MNVGRLGQYVGLLLMVIGVLAFDVRGAADPRQRVIGWAVVGVGVAIYVLATGMRLLGWPRRNRGPRQDV